MWSTLSGTSSGDKFHFSALPRQTGWVSLLPWALSHHVQGQASEQSKHPGCCCNNHYLSVKPLLIPCRFLTIVNTMSIPFWRINACRYISIPHTAPWNICSLKLWCWSPTQEQVNHEGRIYPHSPSVEHKSIIYALSIYKHPGRCPAQ